MKKQDLECARLIGPEDIAPGDYVTVSHVTYELVPLFVLEDEPWKPRELDPQRVTVMCGNAGRPLKVMAVCPPFVLVKDAQGKPESLDLRRCRLARLPKRYGRAAFAALRKQKGSTAEED